MKDIEAFVRYFQENRVKVTAKKHWIPFKHLKIIEEKFINPAKDSYKFLDEKENRGEEKRKPLFYPCVLGSPLFGVEELIVLIVMWIYFIEASYGAYERSHIKAELIHTWVKSPQKAALVRSITSAITFILSLIMISWTYPFLSGALPKEVLPRLYCYQCIISKALFLLEQF